VQAALGFKQQVLIGGLLVVAGHHYEVLRKGMFVAGVVMLAGTIVWLGQDEFSGSLLVIRGILAVAYH
jgi:hypothetical protein